MSLYRNLFLGLLLIIPHCGIGQVNLNLNILPADNDPQLYEEGEAGWSSDAPNASALVYHLTGTIVDDTVLVDSVNGYNFKINNNDFESNSYGGVPFKSIATISPPSSGETGYAQVLAADADTFWYTGAGAPRSIPITSLFQNIDFSNRLFCRHTERVVNDSLEETTPPLVTDICGYSSAQTITSTFTDYFGAIIAPDTAGNMFVSKDGNDGSGDGSWDYPYLTIQAAYDAAADNDTIFVLQGTYDDGTDLDLDNVGVTQTIIGTGVVTVQGSGTTYVINHDDGVLTLNHLIIDGEDNTGEGVRENTHDLLTLNKCKVHNYTSKASANFVGSTKEYYDCIFLDDYTECLDDDKMYGCYMSHQSYVNSEYFFYNKSVVSANNAVSIAHTYDLGVNDTINIKYNLFRMTNNRVGVDVYTLDVDQNDLHVFIERNRFIYTGSSGSMNNPVNVRPTDVSADGTYKLYTLVRFNEFYDSTTTDVAAGTLNFGIDVSGQSNLYDSSGVSITIEKNYFHSIPNAANRTAIVVNPNSYKGKINIGYNRIFMNSDEGPAISFGEGTGDQMTPGSEIVGNFIQGPYKNYPESSGGFHGMLVNGGEDFIIKYNWVEYCPLGFAIKDKGGLDHYTSGHGMFYNVGFNNSAQFYWRAVDSVPCYNNTFANHDSVDVSRWGAMDAQGYGDDTICRGHQFDNNIFSYTSKTGAGTAHFMADTAAFDGTADFLWNNNIFNTGAGHTLWLTESGAGPITFTYSEAVTEGWITNGDSTTVTFTNIYGDDLTLQAGSNGIDDGTTLNAAYDDGLDTTSNWHGYVDSTDVDLWPTIVTKQQTGSWDRGAYVK